MTRAECASILDLIAASIGTRVRRTDVIRRSRAAISSAQYVHFAKYIISYFGVAAVINLIGCLYSSLIFSNIELEAS